MPEKEYQPLSQFTRLPRNAKDHSLDEIWKSISRFGFVDPVIVNKTTGHILSGHGRVDALQRAKAASQKPPKGIRSQDGEWLVPVHLVEIPEGDEEPLAIALNRLVEVGGWDENALANILSDLAAQNTLEGTGWDGDSLDDLLRHLVAPLPEDWAEAFESKANIGDLETITISFTLKPEQANMVKETLRALDSNHNRALVMMAEKCQNLLSTP